MLLRISSKSVIIKCFSLSVNRFALSIRYFDFVINFCVVVSVVVIKELISVVVRVLPMFFVSVFVQADTERNIDIKTIAAIILFINCPFFK